MNNSNNRNNSNSSNSSNSMNNTNNSNTANNSKNLYDDGNIPEIDLPKKKNVGESVEPLPESSRPRKDGPGGE